ncbi:MAG: diguanylate cyclase [Proteobacteria bacterium]|nr:diguanylate cyclase [Pseudomonadota bacterium]MBU1687225.1 diguanylate cyclase [Pseudomonadota bacterium]
MLQTTDTHASTGYRLGQSIRILHITQSPDDFRLVKETLIAGERHVAFVLIHADLFSKALEQIARTSFDLFLLDLNLPDCSVLEAIPLLGKTHPSRPVIVLVGRDELHLGLQAIQAGAADYLNRNRIDPGQLNHTLCAAIERRRQNLELRERNSELEILYNLSTLLVSTLDRETLFAGILKTLTALPQLAVQARGLFFLVEEDRLRLAGHLGHIEPSPACHKNLKIGDCLCGRVAKTGALLISDNCRSDPRHTIQAEELHGHIIIPLSGHGGVVGVLCLYTATGVRLSEENSRMLRTAGQLIGMAIDNVRLFEEETLHANCDALTGLINRRCLAMSLEKSIALAKRFNRPLSALMIDIDHFKKFNDTCGHLEGDSLLLKVANFISHEIRGMDVAARFGGEEFLVLLPETNLSEAESIAERIRQVVASGAEVTISLGVSCYSPEDGDGNDLLQHADTALYRAKINGRNRVEVYGDTPFFTKV